MKAAILYVHGRGGSPEEAEHYRTLCPGYDAVGLTYQGNTPWDTKEEILAAYRSLADRYDRLTLVGNSIGAYFAMHALQGEVLDRALLISPILDMEGLIGAMMGWAGVTETALQEQGTVETDFGEPLRWDYLQYVRAHPIRWTAPTAVLYGEKDHMTPRATAEAFCQDHGAKLTVLAGGEHWFHTPAQMAFLDRWIRETLPHTALVRLRRIERMETLYEELRTDCPGPERAEKLRRLTDYYESPVWMADVDADRAGELPQTLKRGVLSEDAIYDLLCTEEET